MTDTRTDPPGTTAAPPGPAPRSASGRSGRGRLRRRVVTGLRLTAALALVGGVYAGLAPDTRAAAGPTLSAAAADGQVLYDRSCISCHGENAQGVPGHGPSLIGVGSADVYFQVSTGRMPAPRQQQEPPRTVPKFTDSQINDLGAYIEALGGGPQVPNSANLAAGGDVARGGTLFRLNCSSCHAFGGSGGALVAGNYAPSLYTASDRQIYAAMLSGPQNMPVFGDNELTPQDKADIIAYIDNLKTTPDPGGWGLGRLGPTTEALAIFLVGMVSILFATLWIAGKS